jgi:hypothetical protein
LCHIIGGTYLRSKADGNTLKHRSSNGVEEVEHWREVSESVVREPCPRGMEAHWKGSALSTPGVGWVNEVLRPKGTDFRLHHWVSEVYTID